MDDNKAFVIFVIAASFCGAIAISVTSYVGGQTEQKEIELKIQQEKTKQLEIKHGKDTTNIQR